MHCHLTTQLTFFLDQIIQDRGNRPVSVRLSDAESIIGVDAPLHLFLLRPPRASQLIQVEMSSPSQLTVSELAANIHEISDNSRDSDIIIQEDEMDDTVIKPNPLDSLECGIELPPQLQTPIVLVDIDSFLPLLMCLPPTALLLEDNAYYIDGAINAEDWNLISHYAKRVRGFTLRDELDKNIPCIPIETILRLAQLQHPDKPLFPSLERLSVVQANSNLSHLPLFLSPSIRTLEIASLSSASAPSFRSFLTALITMSAQHVQELILGPGRLPEPLLQTFFRFEHVRYLELKDVVDPFDFTLIERVGALSQLEKLVVDARNAQYAGRVDPPQPPAPILEFGSEESASDNRDPGSSQLLHPKFPRLSSISVTGNLMLIGDLLHFLRTAKLHEANLTFVPSAMSTEWWMAKVPVPVNPVPLPEKEPLKLPEPKPMPMIRHIKHCKCCKKGRAARTQMLEGEEGRDSTPWDISPPLWEEKEKCGSGSIWGLPTHPPPPPPPPIDGEIIDKNFGRLSSLGKESLQSLCVEQVNGDSRYTYPAFPSSAFQSLVHIPTLLDLSIVGWDIEAVDASLRLLPDTSNLRALSLPISELREGISLHTLRYIAENCSSMEHIQCRIDRFLDQPQEFERSLTSPLSHGLKVLSVGSNTAPDQDRLRVAQYLYSLFPVLDELKTRPGFNSEQWEYVLTLLKIYQSNRTVDAKRVIA
ncbi:unnamed protein product [Cyclocybe aegerita]|uniref:Uncharacterized protein n=1 Tax=Cyclocybe aegerita TaxID=1973307 RepID=A0A8S0VRG4_CYCAE|nr:unnamed protein product [Cyclocybe aegerita]